MKTKLLFAVVALFAVSALSAQEARYELKSGIIKRTMEMFGQKYETTQYFDDNGKVEASLFSMDVQGTTTRMHTITKGDVSTMINLDNKTGRKMTMPFKPINFLNTTQEMKDQYKLKELEGEETIAGKPCKKYSMEIEMMGQSVSVTSWVWKGMALKSVSSVGGMTITDEATEIKENVAVDAANFVVPADVTIEEM